MPASVNRRSVACASYGVQVIGSILFVLAPGESGPWLILGIALFGLGIGNATSLPSIARQEFPPAETARLAPLVVAIVKEVLPSPRRCLAFARAQPGQCKRVGGAVSLRRRNPMRGPQLIPGFLEPLRWP